MRSHYGEAARGRLTRSGMIILLILILLLLSAWNTGENLLYIVFGGVMGMFFLSVAAARWTLRRVGVRREAPYAVFRGEPFSCPIYVNNHKRFMPTLGVCLEQGGRTAGYVVRIPGKTQARLSLDCTFEKRGLYPLPPLSLRTPFPFGFMEQVRRYRDGVEVLVYPRVRTARISAFDQQSMLPFAPARVSGEGDEFFALREYVRGDDLRLVVWRISARLGVWMVREMGVGHVRAVTFVLDTRRGTSSDFDARFEEAVEMIASLSVTLLRRHYSVGIFTPEASVSCVKGTSQEQRILDLLARIQPAPPGAFPDFEERARHLTAEPMRVLYLSPETSLHPERQEWMTGISVLNPEAVVYG